MPSTHPNGIHIVARATGTTLPHAACDFKHSERCGNVSTVILAVRAPRRHLCFAPNSARTNTAVTADPRIATDLTTANVSGLSAAKVMSSPWALAHNHGESQLIISGR
jgi:hypothetical protein